MGEYVFYNFATALYLEGSRASDYIPKHGMVLAEYTDYDLVLRLTVYTLDGLRNESVFAWLEYRANPDNNGYTLVDVSHAIFDESKSVKAQRLPSKSALGRLIYGRLKVV